MRMSILLRPCFSLVLLAPALVHAATLENPANGSFYSGLGVISGWKCTANGLLTVRFNDGDPIPLAYGNARGDVRNAGACPSARVGFVSIMNWAELGDGTHTAVAYDDGVEFARSTFTVTTLGTPFLQGASREVDVFDFPELGTDVLLKWQPSLQNFIITDRVASPKHDADSYTLSCDHGLVCTEWTVTSQSAYDRYSDELCRDIESGSVLSGGCPALPSCYYVIDEDESDITAIRTYYPDAGESLVREVCEESDGIFIPSN